MEYEICPCGKIAYPTRADARKAAAGIRRNGKGESKIYRCPATGVWHRASKQPRRPKVRVDRFERPYYPRP